MPLFWRKQFNVINWAGRLDFNISWFTKITTNRSLQLISTANLSCIRSPVIAQVRFAFKASQTYSRRSLLAQMPVTPWP